MSTRTASGVRKGHGWVFRRGARAPAQARIGLGPVTVVVANELTLATINHFGDLYHLTWR